MENIWVEQIIKSMTLEEKVGQVLMVSFFEINSDTVDAIIDSIKKYNLGGIFHAFNERAVLAECIKMMQSISKIPLLVSSDYESGTGGIIKEGVTFPRSMARGTVQDLDVEYRIGAITAAQGRAVGTNITFSPVVDVNINRLCPDINLRAYGEDKDTVCKLSIPYIRGIQDNGMLATAKHFPGNGGTDMDQHICTAIINGTLEEIKEIFLDTYEKIFEESDVGAVMVAHLEVPAIVTEINPGTGRLVPTSVSHEAITGVLRNQLGFKGLVITDAMNMGGITVHYTRPEAAVKALKAGNDMLLVFNPESFEIEYNAVLSAVKSGKLPGERLDDAVRSVLNAKSKLNLHIDKGLPRDSGDMEEIFDMESSEKLRQDISSKAITLLRNKDGVLPIKGIKAKKAAVLNIFHPDRKTLASQGQPPIEEIVSKQLSDRGAEVKVFEISDELTVPEIRKIVEDIRGFDYVFMNFLVIPSWGIGCNIPNKCALRLFMFGILSADVPVIITSFGDPYMLYYFPTAPVYMCTYDESFTSQECAVKAWLGEIPVTGKSPISLKGIFKKGDGITI